MTDLSILLSRVESGSGADRELDREVFFALRKPPYRFPDEKTGTPVHDHFPAYTTDLNAVVALAEARDVYWTIWSRPADINGYRARITDIDATLDNTFEGYGNTPARALLAALIRTEMEKVK